MGIGVPCQVGYRVPRAGGAARGGQGKAFSKRTQLDEREERKTLFAKRSEMGRRDYL